MRTLTATSLGPLPRVGFLIAVSLVGTPLAQAAGLFPEDGSQTATRWYHDPASLRELDVEPSLREALAGRLELRDMGHNYEWIQDIALFGDDGRFWVQAPMPAIDKVLGGLTRGVFSDDDGAFGGAYFRRVSASDARELGLRTKELKWTVVEGGELVSGRFSDGSPYVLLAHDVLTRSESYLRHLRMDPSQARNLIAEDLEVPTENLFFLRAYPHLDLILTAAPGGRIFLHDPASTAETLAQLKNRADTPVAERARLDRMEKLYRGQILRRGYALEATGEWEFRLIDENERTLSADPRFRVRRVVGVFDDLEGDEGWPRVVERVNFFNGFWIHDPSGGRIHLTNRAEGLSSLESYWRRLMREEGAVDARFPGRYSSGAGLDCMGAPAP